jgi:hypothetical protein
MTSLTSIKSNQPERSTNVVHFYSNDGIASTASSIHILLTVGIRCSPCTMQRMNPWGSSKDIIGPSSAMPTHNFFQPLESIADHPMLGNGRKSEPPLLSGPVS